MPNTLLPTGLCGAVFQVHPSASGSGLCGGVSTDEIDKNALDLNLLTKLPLCEGVFTDKGLADEEFTDVECDVEVGMEGVESVIAGLESGLAFASKSFLMVSTKLVISDGRAEEASK